ncbi:hypothetical protein [Sinorhizobium fredii]|uniref:hypothetical protein n=1 Tax=Rhizobium fredii TaxID=380 RepID=UPI0035124663
MKRATTLLLGGLFVASPVCAQDTVPWREISGWGILMDSTMGNACFVATGYEDGTILRLGFDLRETKSIYLALGNKNWASLEPGKDYPLQIQFDGNPVWNATARALNLDGANYLVVSTTDTNFANEFTRKLAMRATFNGRQVASLRLSGSARAVDEMLNCQKAVNDAIANKNTPNAPKDPFQANPGVRNANDPFEM